MGRSRARGRSRAATLYGMLMLRRVVPIMLATIAAIGLAGAAEARCSYRHPTVLFGAGASDCPQSSADCSAFHQNLDSSVDIWRSQGGGLVRLIGHSDTLPSAGDSFLLSEQRAVTVRDYLIARGIPAEQITLEARGELDLARPTADGVAETLNNRVEVDLTDGLRRALEGQRREYAVQLEAALAAGLQPPPRPPCI